MRDRQFAGHGGYETGVQFYEDPHTLAGQSQVLSSNGLETRNLHGAGTQHELTHPAIEHLQLVTFGRHSVAKTWRPYKDLKLCYKYSSNR